MTVVARKDPQAIADAVSYPLRRKVPLSRIENARQFVEAYDEILDAKLLDAIATSSVSTDWSEMGGRGIMFQNGSLWLDDDGKVIAINHQTEKGKHKRAELIEADKRQLSGSLRDFTEPVLEWETAKFRIRIDRLPDDKFRYAAWLVNKKPAEQPELVLNNGSLTFDGSGGNHHYDFKSGPYHYRCMVNEIGAADDPPGELEVTKNDKVVLTQPVVKVVKGQ
ncbi:hypothetical protein GMLC_23650 [Geomonas limicola]|uniref:Uncharacterized protein n=2 Tax=Geomonas limicola TaxID=2740186 RepID=A0A6V8N885_9BACT|nr:hypothetical protein GMLC_23650 [Geomonas limicola]